MTAFRIYLRVVSSSLQPEDITARLGVSPDETAAIGSQRRHGSLPREHSIWARHVRASQSSARPEDLEPSVLAWGMGFANTVGELVEKGDVVASLEIVQEIRDLDGSIEKGIFLSSELMAWLSVARASLDIDQYIYHECPETADRHDA